MTDSYGSGPSPKRVRTGSLSAVDVALWDLAARVAGVPLYSSEGNDRRGGNRISQAIQRLL